MATFAIGDIQGCYRTLKRLLRRAGFQPRRDRLWSVGDLVNRGPRSLDVLRWARDQGRGLVSVLGNHDLYLLARARGQVRRERQDTLDPVLDAPDRGALLAWLRRRPFAHAQAGRLLVHAGVRPGWTAGDVLTRSRQLSKVLRGPDSARFLAAVTARFDGTARASAAEAARSLTRVRFLDHSGRPLGGLNGPPGTSPDGAIPWFQYPGRRTAGWTVVFGHWSALGLLLRPRLLGVDTGCVWGGPLTAVRLDDGTVFQEPWAG